MSLSYMYTESTSDINILNFTFSLINLSDAWFAWLLVQNKIIKYKNFHCFMRICHLSFTTSKPKFECLWVFLGEVFILSFQALKIFMVLIILI